MSKVFFFKHWNENKYITHSSSSLAVSDVEHATMPRQLHFSWKRDKFGSFLAIPKIAIKGSGCSVWQGIAESDWKTEGQKPCKDGHDQNVSQRNRRILT